MALGNNYWLMVIVSIKLGVKGVNATFFKELETVSKDKSR